MTERAISFCRIPKGGRVLDIGCGLGAATDYLRKYRWLNAVGLDISESLLDQSRYLFPGNARIRGDAHFLPVSDESLAAVILECALSLMDAPDRVLSECRRVLAPDGYIVILDIYLRLGDSVGEDAVFPANCCLNGAVALETMENRLTGAGFQVTAVEDHSDRLKTFAAKLVFESEGLKDFWKPFLNQETADNPSQPVSSARPGYVLMAAKKGVFHE